MGAKAINSEAALVSHRNQELEGLPETRRAREEVKQSRLSSYEILKLRKMKSCRAPMEAGGMC